MAMQETPTFDAPIPRESLTHELGARPWQSPPQYATVEDALDFYIPRFANEEVVKQLLDVLNMGVPVTTLANTIQLGNVMEGRHSIDVGMLVLPVLMELIMFIAESEGVEYTSGLEQEKKLRSTLVESALIQLEEQTEEQDETETTDEPEEVEEEPVVERKGLMGRI